MDEIIVQLQKIFRRILRQPQLILSGEMSAQDVEGWDSLAHINLVIAIEKEFKVRFKTTDITGLKNVGEIAELILSRRKKADEKPQPAAAAVRVEAFIAPREAVTAPKNIGEIHFDRNSADEEEPTVVKIYVAAGSQVTAGTSLFDMENSKATQEVVAPVDGFLAHALKVGDRLPFGTTVARVVPESSQASVASAISQLGTEKRAWILGRAVSGVRTPPQDRAPEKTRAHPRKLEEIRVLSGGAGNTMMSVVGVSLGVVDITRQTGDFFEGKILDLVAFEAAKLMRKYPKLNAAYRDNGVEFHSAVNAGIAFDEGERLVVYGIADADKKDLSAIRLEIEDALTKYIERRLTPDEVSRATFAITDISSLNMDFIFPILPAGHSCIIGITRNSLQQFALYLAYDHRVTEGLVAGGFLHEMRARILSFSQENAVSPRCSFCEKSAEEEAKLFRGRGLLKLIDAQGDEVLACHSCWSGW